MASEPKDGTTIDKSEEARNLAQEAVEARQEGDREEAKFLADEAKALDPAAAAEVLKPAGKGE